MENTRTNRLIKRFHESEKELLEFTENSAVRPILNHYHHLISKRNESLNEAVRAIKSELQRSNRDELVIEGMGARKKNNSYFDVNYLRAYLPEDKIKLVMREKVEYILDEPTLHRLVRQGEIDPKIVKDAYKEKPPTLASLPGTPKEWTMPPLPNATGETEHD